MAVVEVPVGRGKYNVSCQNGQEETIKAIAKKLNERTNRMALSIGRADNEILLLMTALTLENEVAELHKQLKEGVAIEGNKEKASNSNSKIPDQEGEDNVLESSQNFYSKEQVEKYFKSTEDLFSSILNQIEKLANNVEDSTI